MVEIKLEKDDFDRLIKLVFLGNWLANLYREPAERLKEFDTLEQQLYSTAKENGFEHYFKSDGASKQLMPSEDFVLKTNLLKLIDDYNEETFWNELAHRLAVRDLLQKYSEDDLDKMSTEEYQKNRQPFCDKYFNEFETNGLENLVISK